MFAGLGGACLSETVATIAKLILSCINRILKKKKKKKTGYLLLRRSGTARLYFSVIKADNFVSNFNS